MFSVFFQFDFVKLALSSVKVGSVLCRMPLYEVSAGVKSNGSTNKLTLETSAFESLYGGQFTLSTQLIKPN